MRTLEVRKTLHDLQIWLPVMCRQNKRRFTREAFISFPSSQQCWLCYPQKLAFPHAFAKDSHVSCPLYLHVKVTGNKLFHELWRSFFYWTWVIKNIQNDGKYCFFCTIRNRRVSIVSHFHGVSGIGKLCRNYAVHPHKYIVPETISQYRFRCAGNMIVRGIIRKSHVLNITDKVQ